MNAKALHRRARAETWAFVAAGIGMTGAGLWSLLNGPPGGLVWLVSLAIFGPITIFLAIIEYFTYLETIEEDRYLPDAEREPDPDKVWPTIPPYGHE